MEKVKNDHFRAKNWFYFILIFYKFLRKKSPEIAGDNNNDSKRIFFCLIVLPFSLHIEQYFVPEFVSLI